MKRNHHKVGQDVVDEKTIVGIKALKTKIFLWRLFLGVVVDLLEM